MLLLWFTEIRQKLLYFCFISDIIEVEMIEIRHINSFLLSVFGIVINNDKIYKMYDPFRTLTM